MLSLPLWPFRDAPIPPFWGPPTSLDNYCEEVGQFFSLVVASSGASVSSAEHESGHQDYIITGYAAEFINTLTNLTYVFYAYHGIRNSKPGSYVSVDTLPYIGLGCVGLGSAAFHSSVKCQSQWSDDLAMLLATGIVLHRVMSFDKSARWGRNFAYILSVILSGVMIIHCYLNERIIHQATFVVMVIWVAVRTASLIDQRVGNPELKRSLHRLSRSGMVLAVAAYAVWILDQRACSTLRTFRRAIGIPWGFLTELHGWWHIFSGVAVYIYIVLVEHATADLNHQDGNRNPKRYAWPVSFMLQHLNDEKSKQS